MTSDPEWPEFLIPAEVAAILRVSKMTVYRLIARGEMEAVRAGRGYRVRAETLRAYLAPAAQP
jgi:excisionase family DNA binding protein